MKHLLLLSLFSLTALAKPAATGVELTRFVHPEGKEIVTLECNEVCKVTRFAPGSEAANGEIPRKTAEAEVGRFMKEVPTHNAAEGVPLAMSWKVWSGKKASTGAITEDEARSLTGGDVGKRAKAIARLELALTSALKPN